MMLAKLATLGFLKIKVFWNKGPEVTNLVYGVTSKILSCDSNYTANIVMLSKFGNSSISIIWE